MFNFQNLVMGDKKQKTVVIGAGPVGALAALYAAQRGHEVEIYELRSGTFCIFSSLCRDAREGFEIHLLSQVTRLSLI